MTEQQDMFPGPERVKKMKALMVAKARDVLAMYKKYEDLGKYFVLFAKYQDSLSLYTDRDTVLGNFDAAVRKADTLLEEIKSGGIAVEDMKNLQEEIAMMERQEALLNGGSLAFALPGRTLSSDQGTNEEEPI